MLPTVSSSASSKVRQAKISFPSASSLVKDGVGSFQAEELLLLKLQDLPCPHEVKPVLYIQVQSLQLIFGTLAHLLRKRKMVLKIAKYPKSCNTCGSQKLISNSPRILFMANRENLIFPGFDHSLGLHILLFWMELFVCHVFCLGDVLVPMHLNWKG